MIFNKSDLLSSPHCQTVESDRFLPPVQTHLSCFVLRDSEQLIKSLIDSSQKPQIEMPSIFTEFLSTLPLTNKNVDPAVHSFSTLVIFWSLSSPLPRSNVSGFSFCDKSSTVVVGFSALSSTGKQGDDKKT